MKQKERRLQQRYSLQIEAKLTADEDSAGNKVRELSTATNISSGGAFVTTHVKIPLASKVYLEFLIDYEQLKKLRFILSLNSLKKFSGTKMWIKTSGIVIRAEENGLGIIFDKDYQLSPMDANTDK